MSLKMFDGNDLSHDLITDNKTNNEAKKYI